MLTQCPDWGDPADETASTTDAGSASASTFRPRARAFLGRELIYRAVKFELTSPEGLIAECIETKYLSSLIYRAQ
jgi:hypothetical protein